MFCHWVCVCLCVCSLYFEQNISFCQNYDPQQDPAPPLQKTQHYTRNKCFGGLSRSLRTHRVLAGKILTCMPAGDSKSEPHQEKNLLSSFSVGAQSHGNTHQQLAAPRFNRTTRLNLGAFAAPQRACAAKERQQRNKYQNGVFFSS